MNVLSFTVWRSPLTICFDDGDEVYMFLMTNNNMLASFPCNYRTRRVVVVLWRYRFGPSNNGIFGGDIKGSYYNLWDRITLCLDDRGRREKPLVDSRDELPSHNLAIALPIFTVLDGTSGSRSANCMGGCTCVCKTRTVRNHASYGERAQ
jgi:hypothetical protein